MKIRIIAHLDMDAFFAAIEERDKPHLKDKPIVVGADPQEGRGRGVVSTANYKARGYGIHSAMPISQAWRLAEKAKNQGKPETAFIRGNFTRYAEVSENILAIIRKYVPVVEEASIDEFYLDLSHTKTLEAAKRLCEKIKEEIRNKEQLTASVGIGPNKLIAKIASDIKKPDGLTLVTEEETEAFLELLPIRKIPGIGPKTEAFFNEKGISLVRDLKKFSKDELKEMLGKWGLDLYEKIRGHDDSPVQKEYEIKSIGEQETFLKDTRDASFIVERLSLLCENVIKRSKESGFQSFRTIVITVRFHDFETKTRSYTLEKPTSSLEALEFEALKLFTLFFDKRENPKRKLIRLVGVRIEKLTSTRTSDLPKLEKVMRGLSRKDQ